MHLLGAPVNNTCLLYTSSAFHTVLDMAAIRTKYLQPALSLVNPQFEIAPRMYLNDHDKPIPFYKAGLKEEDMEMIKKRKMCIRDRQYFIKMYPSGIRTIR